MQLLTGDVLVYLTRVNRRLAAQPSALSKSLACGWRKCPLPGGLNDGFGSRAPVRFRHRRRLQSVLLKAAGQLASADGSWDGPRPAILANEFRYSCCCRACVTAYLHHDSELGGQFRSIGFRQLQSSLLGGSRSEAFICVGCEPTGSTLARCLLMLHVAHVEPHLSELVDLVRRKARRGCLSRIMERSIAWAPFRRRHACWCTSTLSV